jgi:Family of unknown function (DUF6502)
LNQNKTNTVGENKGAELSAAFFHAVERVLRPICRVLVRHGFTVHDGIELVKRAFVAAGADVISQERGFPVTKARLSLTTGVPQSEIERIRRQLAASVDLSETRGAQVMRVIASWHLDQRFTIQFVDTPRALAMEERQGSPSFEELVREFAPALHWKSLLEELEELGAVSIQKETGQVHLKARAYIPKPFAVTDSERYGRLLSAYATTMDVNSRKEGPGLGRFDRAVIADFPISIEDEELYHLLVREQGQKFLEMLDAWLAGRARADENGRRPGTAVFYLVETDVQPRRDSYEPISSPWSEKSDSETNTDDTFGGDDSKVIDTLTFKGPGRI